MFVCIAETANHLNLGEKARIRGKVTRAISDKISAARNIVAARAKKQGNLV